MEDYTSSSSRAANMDSSVLVPLGTVEESSQLLCMNHHQYQTWNGGGLHKTLCMQGGEDDSSYVKNSEAPALAISLSKPLLTEAIQLMTLFKGQDSLRIADLGCATGYNTLSTVELVVENLRGRYSKECDIEPEIEVFFSDLPCNDFNTLFRSLPSFTDADKKQYFAAGVPGSFYHRLFPKGKLHVAVSLSALHWLSQVLCVTILGFYFCHASRYLSFYSSYVYNNI